MWLTPQAGYRKWAPVYDHSVNPLLALEERLLKPLLNTKPGDCALDLAAGTGRWLSYLLRLGADAKGLDFCPDMLAVAAQKPGLRGRLVQGDLCALPFAQDCADLVICSFALSYIQDVFSALHECARVARRVLLCDMHPVALETGWSRSFCAGGLWYSLAHYHHPKALLCDAARSAGLECETSLEAGFGEPERELFALAGRPDLFESVRTVPAVLISAWRRA